MKPGKEGRRVVSLWLPSFATDRQQQKQSAPGFPQSDTDARSKPLATVIAKHGGLRIAAVNRAAAANGVKPGLSLADARTVLPSLETATADPVGDQRALEALADWCSRYTPLTAVDSEKSDGGDRGIWLDISGCAHLFGDEKTLLANLSECLRRIGYANAMAVADTYGAAWAAARFTSRGPNCRIVVPHDGHETALAPLPVAGLRLSSSIIEGLHRMGLRRIGDLISLPRAPLAARFGLLPARRLDQALGRLEEPFEPHRPVPGFQARIVFAEPIGRQSDIVSALRRLLDTLCCQLANARQGARRLRLVCCRSDGTISEVAVGTSQPVRDPKILERLFFNELENLEARFGIDAMVLTATAFDPLSPTQINLQTGDGSKGEALGAGILDLIDRLGNRLGPNRILRLEARASHIPERASREISALGCRIDGTTPVAGDTGQAPAAPRPVRLLPLPVPIEVIAPVPDHPPVMFRWRGTQHRVARAEGPERIGPEWWLQPPEEIASGQVRTRDYYRIEDTDGARFWVYLDGPYRADAPPRWYLHGFFP